MRIFVRDTALALLPALPFFIWRFPADYTSYPSSTLLLLLLISPVAEELIFRGVMQEYLLRRSPAKEGKYLSNIAVSIVFTGAHLLVHLSPQRLLVFFPSLVLGAHYSKHRKVLPVILIHAIYNFSIL
jgi:membrane protease YdiL (CAAX protease family)